MVDHSDPINSHFHSSVSKMFFFLNISTRTFFFSSNDKHNTGPASRAVTSAVLLRDALQCFSIVPRVIM